MGAIKTPCRQGTKSGFNASHIYDRDDEALVGLYGIPINTRVSEVPDHFAAGMAVAAEIVKAINSHTALVEALRDVLEWIDNWSPEFIQDDEWSETSLKARAALALAGEAP